MITSLAKVNPSAILVILVGALVTWLSQNRVFFMITFAISALGVGEASLASSFKGDNKPFAGVT